MLAGREGFVLVLLLAQFASSFNVDGPAFTAHVEPQHELRPDDQPEHASGHHGQLGGRYSDVATGDHRGGATALEARAAAAPAAARVRAAGPAPPVHAGVVPAVPQSVPPRRLPASPAEASPTQLAREPGLVLIVQTPGAKEDISFFDPFGILYWSCVGLLVFVMYKTESGDVFHKEGSSQNASGVPESDLPANLWTLNLAAAIGQCAVQGRPLWPSVVALLSLLMGALQCLALFLVAHDINPNAVPVTEHPSTPWIHSGWSVNTMKWIMVVFLSLFMVNEASDCRVNLEAILVTNSSRFCMPKPVVFVVASMQMVVVVLVVWCGVSAVLSFQAVPDILYSSMSVTFIANVDEAFFQFLKNLLDVEAEFTIVHGAETSMRRLRNRLFHALDVDKDGVVTEAEMEAAHSSVFQAAGTHEAVEDFHHNDVPLWVQVALRCMTVAPFALGFGLISRAFYTGAMPTDRVHALKRDIMQHG